MKTIHAFLLAFSTLILSACADSLESAAGSCDNKLCVTDFAGNQVNLARPATRIIAMAPHAVENVFSAGAGDKLVGVVDYSNYPEAASKLPVVVGYQSINFEKIIELEPDLIIAWESGNSHAAVSRLRELGFTVYMDEPKSVGDIAKSLKDIGVLADTSEVAIPVAERFLRDFGRITTKYSQSQSVSVFYQVWNSPLQTINGEHVITSAIEACGGQNIYAEEFAVAPVINIESVLERDPQAIIAGGMGEGRPAWLDEWLQWPTLNAAKNNHLFHVNPDHTQRHTVRLLLGIKAICAQLDEVRAVLKQAG